MDGRVLRSEPGLVQSLRRRLAPLIRPLQWVGRLRFRLNPGHAILEALLVGALLAFIFSLLDVQVQLPHRMLHFGPSSSTAGLLAALLCAFRMALPPDSWWSRSGRKRFLIEIAAVVLVSVLSVAIGVLLLRFSTDEGRAIRASLNFLIPNVIIFLFMRMWIYGWCFWSRLRRRHVRWALTHALIMIVVLGTLLAGSYAFLRRAISQWGAPQFFGDETGWHEIPLPALITAFEAAERLLQEVITLGAGPLILLALPLALFSYLVAGQLTRRLELLVAATSALRAGDYSVRVTITGEDEVAQLETDFNAMASALQRTIRELEDERTKSERLLLNILPESIARRLKEDQRAIADGFADVTVLFADIVDFTRTSAGLPPAEIVSWLNEIFSAFDSLAEHYGLEKIKTIGDAYMVVGGLPNPRVDHAEAIAEMALAMQELVAQQQAPNGEPLHIRIGMNTGQVVAGVIGTKKFLYDLWGDTVNTASRMEANGVSGSIQVTQATYEQLKERYVFAPRGPIAIKGKGEMLTYLLRGRKEELGTSS